MLHVWNSYLHKNHKHLSNSLHSTHLCSSKYSPVIPRLSSEHLGLVYCGGVGTVIEPIPSLWLLVDCFGPG